MFKMVYTNHARNKNSFEPKMIVTCRWKNSLSVFWIRTFWIFVSFRYFLSPVWSYFYIWFKKWFQKVPSFSLFSSFIHSSIMLTNVVEYGKRKEQEKKKICIRIKIASWKREYSVIPKENGCVYVCKRLYRSDLPTAVHGPYFYIFMGNFPNFVNNPCILRITAKVIA